METLRFSGLTACLRSKRPAVRIGPGVPQVAVKSPPQEEQRPDPGRSEPLLTRCFVHRIPPGVP